MHVIPVLDIKDRMVVRARMGQRAFYQPIETQLSKTSDPVDVARGLLSVHSFDAFYVADLDAIERTGDNDATLDRLRRAFPGVTFWVDNGIADVGRARDWISAAPSGCLVLGSESQTDPTLVRHFANDERIILSLDFRGASFVGPPQLLTDPACWPRRIIVMTLAQVGSGAGPDLARLREIRASALDRTIYAAGGIRDAADLAALKRLGIAGALVATSLHDGRLARADFPNL